MLEREQIGEPNHEVSAGVQKIVGNTSRSSTQDGNFYESGLDLA